MCSCMKLIAHSIQFPKRVVGNQSTEKSALWIATELYQQGLEVQLHEFQLSKGISTSIQ